MIDIVREIASIQRTVGTGQVPAGEGNSVRLRRTLDAPIAEVWDAVTNPERISRWFLPITGDLHLGGRYQLEGNAGGEILACEPPDHFRVSWIAGDVPDGPDASIVDVRLTPAADGGTTLELDHTAVVPEEFWTQYGPGAVGTGWDMGLLGLSLHLTGGSVGDPVAWQLSQEGRDFATRSSNAWGEANVASGTDPEAAATAVANTTAFYTTVPEQPA